jgi:hypothetical protein
MHEYFLVLAHKVERKRKQEPRINIKSKRSDFQNNPLQKSARSE